MKATVPTGDLTRIAKAAGRAVGTSIVRPILGGIRLSLTDGRLTATGTDLEMAISSTVDIGGGDDGIAVVPAKDLLALLGRVGKGDLLVERQNDVLSMTVGRSHLSLRLLPEGEWPLTPSVDDRSQPVAEETWQRITRLAKATSVDSQRPILNAVHLGDHVAVATDAYRVHTATTDLDIDARVPARTMAEAAGLLRSDSVAIAANDRNVTITDGTTAVSSTLVAGDYPPTERFFVDDLPIAATFDADEMCAALALASALTADSGAGIVIAEVRADAIEIKRTSSRGEAIAVVAGDANGEARLRMQPRYFAEAIEHVAPDGGTATLQIETGAKPVFLTGDGVRALVMPVHPPKEEREAA